MSSPLWAAPGSQLFLVAYDSGDGKPYALAVSALAVAQKLARMRGGEVITTAIDRHADMAIDGEQKTYTVEVTWRVPEYVQLSAEAETPAQAMEKALAEVAGHPVGHERALDYESCGPDIVTGIWEGAEAYPRVGAQTLSLPPPSAARLEQAIETLRDAFAQWKGHR